MSVADAKRALRRECSARVVPTADRANALALRVRDHLLASDAWQRCDRLRMFAATGRECPTRPIFDAARDRGLSVEFPRCVGSSLAFERVSGWEDLSPGRYGVLEPAPSASASPSAAPTALLWLVPGLAFDALGRRLGRGGGYYDRALASAPEAATIVGLGFRAQWVDEVPEERHDRRVDALLSETGWVDCGGPSSGLDLGREPLGANERE